MPYRFEDGKGSRDRAAVFIGRVRTLSVSPSLMNHISNEINENDNVPPIIGVYDVSTTTFVAGSGSSLIYLVNYDTVNYVNIDRIFTGAIASSTTLPDTSTYLTVRMGSTFAAGTGTPLPAINLNKAIINVQPEVTILTGATTSGGVETLRRYPTINRIYRQEVIPQKSDGIILGTGNSMEIFLSTLTSATVSVELRFGMVDPKDLGLQRAHIALHA
jgi:hypothetical protein